MRIEISMNEYEELLAYRRAAVLEEFDLDEVDRATVEETILHYVSVEEMKRVASETVAEIRKSKPKPAVVGVDPVSKGNGIVKPRPQKSSYDFGRELAKTVKESKYSKTAQTSRKRDRALEEEERRGW